MFEKLNDNAYLCKKCNAICSSEEEYYGECSWCVSEKKYNYNKAKEEEERKYQNSKSWAIGEDDVGV